MLRTQLAHLDLVGMCEKLLCGFRLSELPKKNAEGHFALRGPIMLTRPVDPLFDLQGSFQMLARPVEVPPGPSALPPARGARRRRTGALACRKRTP